MPLKFIPTAQPRLALSPPTGDAWLHEPKLDGWRLQAVKDARQVTLYSRNGRDLTQRFPTIAAAVRALSARSAVLDGEVTVAGADGAPNFYAVQSARRRRLEATLWVFDLLERDGRDLRALPLVDRKVRLARLMAKAGDGLALVQSFEDGRALLNACQQHRLEGVVSKLRSSPYRAGNRCGWVKVKCSAWLEANRERGSFSISSGSKMLSETMIWKRASGDLKRCQSA